MPCQLMVGFFAYAKSLDINVDKEELEGNFRFLILLIFDWLPSTYNAWIRFDYGHFFFLCVAVNQLVI